MNKTALRPFLDSSLPRVVNSLSPILQPYLMILFSVPFYIDSDGRRWIDELWAKDLLEHTRYIKRLSLAATALYRPAPANSVAFDTHVGLAEITCIDLPSASSTLQALRLLPRTLSILWRSLEQAAIVHTAVAAWPLPEAWILVPMLKLRRRLLYINVESAFWRLVPGQPASFARKVRASISERLNRHCLDRTDISTFTSEDYRRSLLKNRPERGHVVEASWIDEVNLLSKSDENRVAVRQAPGPLRLVFVGRLTAAKGILVLLDAFAAAVRAGETLDLEIYGEGALRVAIAGRLAAPDLAPHARLRESLPYGRPFFEALRQYDAIVVPTLSDEQPRIVFDAYSQGLPVLAARTPGLVQCVREGETGMFFEPGDASSLGATLSRVAADREALRTMATTCIVRAKRATHRRMHEARWRLLTHAFPGLTANTKQVGRA